LRYFAAKKVIKKNKDLALIVRNSLNCMKKPQKTLIFDLFLGDFQKILIKQHISRDLA